MVKVAWFFKKGAHYGTILSVIGDWPSGKATGSGPVIGGSNPSSPAKIRMTFTVVFILAREI